MRSRRGKESFILTQWNITCAAATKNIWSDVSLTPINFSSCLVWPVCLKALYAIPSPPDLLNIEYMLYRGFRLTCGKAWYQ